MNKLSAGNCPYCDSERGIHQGWGMSPEGWANLKDQHDAGHLYFEKVGDTTIVYPPELN